MSVVPSCTMGILGVRTSSQLYFYVVGETGTVSIRSHQPETPWTPIEVYTTKYSLSLPHYISDKVTSLCKLHKVSKAFYAHGI